MRGVGGVLRALVVTLVAVGSAQAAPLVVAGYSFDGGEQAFADDALLVSGNLRHTCAAGSATVPATSIAEALTGSDLVRCVNANELNEGIVEVQFIDNAVSNGPGPDLVIFELSGPLPAGTPEPRERFELSLFDGASFSAFVPFDPVATGFNSGAEPSLDAFAVEVDLGSFGLAGGATIDRLRLRIYDVGLGSASADIAALGALHSVIPEPGSGLLALAGLVGLRAARRLAPGRVRRHARC